MIGPWTHAFNEWKKGNRPTPVPTPMEESTMIRKAIMWTTPRCTISGSFDLVNAIDDAFIVATLVGTFDRFVA